MTSAELAIDILSGKRFNNVETIEAMKLLYQQSCRYASASSGARAIFVGLLSQYPGVMPDSFRGCTIAMPPITWATVRSLNIAYMLETVGSYNACIHVFTDTPDRMAEVHNVIIEFAPNAKPTLK